MPESYRERLESYLSAMLCVKRMHSLGLLTEQDYTHMDTIFARKYGISSSSIYRHNGLLSAGCYGNMSGTKEEATA